MLDYSSYIRSRKSYLNLVNEEALHRLAHTYLLESKDSDLGLEYAKRFAKIILNGSDLTNKKIDSGTHPDVKIYGTTKKFNSDDASEIVSDVLILPYEADKKVYIIANAENMNEESQNKLLKTLEEPPESSYFILSAKTEKTLLQTIISRAKKVVIEEPSQSDIQTLLGWAGYEGDNAEIASACAGGDASKALKMVENASFIKLYNNVFEMFKTMNTSKDILRFIEKFSAKDFVISDFLTICETVAMDLVYFLSGNSNLILNKHKMADIKVIAQTFSAQGLSKILKECFDFRESLYYNVNVTPALDGFLLKFVEVKVKCKK